MLEFAQWIDLFAPADPRQETTNSQRTCICYETWPICLRFEYAREMNGPQILRPWMLGWRSDFSCSGFHEPEQASMIAELMLTEGFLGAQYEAFYDVNPRCLDSSLVRMKVSIKGFTLLMLEDGWSLSSWIIHAMMASLFEAVNMPWCSWCWKTRNNGGGAWIFGCAIWRATLRDWRCGCRYMQTSYFGFTKKLASC